MNWSNKHDRAALAIWLSIIVWGLAAFVARSQPTSQEVAAYLADRPLLAAAISNGATAGGETLTLASNSDTWTNATAFIGYGAIQLPMGWYGQDWDSNDNPRNGIEWFETGWSTALTPENHDTVPQALIHVLRDWGGGSSYDRPTLHVASKGDIRIEPFYSPFSEPIPTEFYGQAYMSLGNEDHPHILRINEVRGTIFTHGAGTVGDEYAAIKPYSRGYSLPLTFYSSISKLNVESTATPTIWGWSGDTNAGDTTLGTFRFMSKAPTIDLFQPTFGEQNPAGVTVFEMWTNQVRFLLGGIRTDTLGAYTNGAINVTNKLNVGISGSAATTQINDNSLQVSAAATSTHFINLYGGNGDHGVGVGTFAGIGTADYITSDGLIVMALTGAPSTAQVIFNVSATPTNTFKGGVYSSQFRSTLANAPANASAPGTAGEIRIDTGFIYVCTAADTWKRVAIATW